MRRSHQPIAVTDPRPAPPHDPPAHATVLDANRDGLPKAVTADGFVWRLDIDGNTFGPPITRAAYTRSRNR